MVDFISYSTELEFLPFEYRLMKRCNRQMHQESQTDCRRCKSIVDKEGDLCFLSFFTRALLKFLLVFVLCYDVNMNMLNLIFVLNFSFTYKYLFIYLFIIQNTITLILLFSHIKKHFFFQKKKPLSKDCRLYRSSRVKYVQQI